MIGDDSYFKSKSSRGSDLLILWIEMMILLRTDFSVCQCVTGIFLCFVALFFLKVLLIAREKGRISLIANFCANRPRIPNCSQNQNNGFVIVYQQKTGSSSIHTRILNGHKKS